MRLRYADRMADDKKIEGFSLTTVLMAAEIEALRARTEEKRMNEDQLRKSILEPVRKIWVLQWSDCCLKINHQCKEYCGILQDQISFFCSSTFDDIHNTCSQPFDEILNLLIQCFCIYPSFLGKLKTEEWKSRFLIITDAGRQNPLLLYERFF